MHLSEYKACWEDSCWSIRIVFTFKKRGVGNVIMSQEMKENVGIIK